MNYPRCTSMTYVIKGKIYVAGGFYITGKRLKSIEIYDPTLDIWFLSGKIGFLYISNSQL
jgi:Kelch motif